MRCLALLCSLVIFAIGCEGATKAKSASKAPVVTAAQFKERALKFVTDISEAADALDAEKDRDNLTTAYTHFMLEYDKLIPIPDEIKSKESIQALLKGATNDFKEAATHARERITESKLDNEAGAEAARSLMQTHLDSLKEECEKARNELDEIK